MAPIPRTTATFCGFPRNGTFIAGLALALGLANAAAAREARNGAGVTAPTAPAVDQFGKLPRPTIKTQAPTGFRLYRPGYRMAGQGVLVSVQICRIPGWAAAGPQRLQVELRNSMGATVDSAQAFLPSLGLRASNNCASSSVRLSTVPSYGDNVTVCAMISGRTNCP